MYVCECVPVYVCECVPVYVCEHVPAWFTELKTDFDMKGTHLFSVKYVYKCTELMLVDSP